jgi:hypothetical protein
VGRTESMLRGDSDDLATVVLATTHDYQSSRHDAFDVADADHVLPP